MNAHFLIKMNSDSALGFNAYTYVCTCFTQYFSQSVRFIYEEVALITHIVVQNRSMGTYVVIHMSKANMYIHTYVLVHDKAALHINLFTMKKLSTH